MNIEEVYPKEWISPADITRPVTVTISHAGKKAVYNQRECREEIKIAVSFSGAKKRLLLNKTQAYVLARMFGLDTDAWIGKRIALTTGLAPNRQQTIIIHAAAPASAPTPTDATPESEES